MSEDIWGGWLFKVLSHLIMHVFPYNKASKHQGNPSAFSSESEEPSSPSPCIKTRHAAGGVGGRGIKSKHWKAESKRGASTEVSLEHKLDGIFQLKTIIKQFIPNMSLFPSAPRTPLLIHIAAHSPSASPSYWILPANKDLRWKHPTAAAWAVWERLLSWRRRTPNFSLGAAGCLLRLF